MSAPDRWTYNMSIAVPSGLDLETLVRSILEKERQHVAYDQILTELVSLGLTIDDAQLAHDRAVGGLVRAATSNGQNAPSQADDPVAWMSYCLCIRDPALVRSIRPTMHRAPPHGAWAPLEPLPPKPWWAFWR